MGEVCVVVQGLGCSLEMATRVRDVDHWIVKGGWRRGWKGFYEKEVFTGVVGVPQGGRCRGLC